MDKLLSAGSAIIKVHKWTQMSSLPDTARALELHWWFNFQQVQAQRNKLSHSYPQFPSHHSALCL